jgi:hypothetical protein
MKNIETSPQDIMSFFVSPPAEGWFLIVRTSFIVFSLVLIGFIIFLFIKSTWFSFRYLYYITEFLTFKPFGAKKIEKDWRKIKIRLETGLESEYKLAVIETDNMLDEMLTRMRFEGDGLGGKLEKMTTATLANLEEVKQAHKVRNNIIHDPNYKISLEEAKKVLDVYEKAFKNLDVF